MAQWRRLSFGSREVVFKSHRAKHFFNLSSFFSLINGYVYLYTKKKKITKTQRLPFRCLISSVNISRNTAGALNHSRIRPALRSISSSKYASPKLSLVSDRIAKEKRWRLLVVVELRRMNLEAFPVQKLQLATCVLVLCLGQSYSALLQQNSIELVYRRIWNFKLQNIRCRQCSLKSLGE